MVLPHVRLRVMPELVVVLALDDVATDARDLFHALIVRQKRPPQVTAESHCVASAIGAAVSAAAQLRRRHATTPARSASTWTRFIASVQPEATVRPRWHGVALSTVCSTPSR